jgi:hypothetical protein
MDIFFKMSKNLLPEGWEERKDAQTGNIFYFNIKTKQTSWTKPTQIPTISSNIPFLKLPTRPPPAIPVNKQSSIPAAPKQPPPLPQSKKPVVIPTVLIIPPTIPLKKPPPIPLSVKPPPPPLEKPPAIPLSVKPPLEKPPVIEKPPVERQQSISPPPQSPQKTINHYRQSSWVPSLITKPVSKDTQFDENLVCICRKFCFMFKF